MRPEFNTGGPDIPGAKAEVRRGIDRGRIRSEGQDAHAEPRSEWKTIPGDFTTKGTKSTKKFINSGRTFPAWCPSWPLCFSLPRHSAALRLRMSVVTFRAVVSRASQ